MIKQETLDKISDDFQSTFSQQKPNNLQNLFYPHEVETVSKIISNHIPNKKLTFQKVVEIAPSYYMYNIIVED